MTQFEFTIGQYGFQDETGYIELDELVEKFEWWLKENSKELLPSYKFVLHGDKIGNFRNQGDNRERMSSLSQSLRQSDDKK